MAVAILGAVIEKVLSLAAEEISLAWGVEKELKRLGGKLEMIQALLSDAQSKQSLGEAVKLWMKKLQSIAFDADIVLDEFGYEVLRQKIEGRKRDKVRRFFSYSNPLSFRLQMAHKIKKVILSLEEVYTEANQIGLRAVELITNLPDFKEKRLTDPFVADSEIVGRDDDALKVINMLISFDFETELPVIAILGMAGQGKTALAQLVYKNDKVVTHFDKTIWLCVSDDFNVEKLLSEMVQSLTQTYCQLTNREVLVNTLKAHLRDKRYLLVIDDVWNEDRDKWDCMKRCLLEIGGSRGSKIMTTTRSHNVALAMETSVDHVLKILSDDQSWVLFEKCAFGEGEAAKTLELIDIGKRIIRRCGGVPLAIKVMGGLLYSKNSENDWLMIERSETWGLSNKENRVFSAIKLSYNHLPSLSLKECFAYCSIFQKDTVMEKDELVQLWMAQELLNPPKGSHLLMEDIGSNYFNILLRNSLMQDAEKDNHNNITSCKMHDLVHDFSLQVSKSYCFHMKDRKVLNSEIEAVHLSIISGEGKMWKSLKGVVPSKLRTLHLKGIGLPEDLFAYCTYLYVLIVEDNDVKELPDAIGEMKHLRYLDISGTQIQMLPKSITLLYNLQTLRVYDLIELPKGFQNLINLRHLYFKCILDDNGCCLLPRIGQLTNLQTLPFFEVSKCKGCQIEELEHLDNLKGTLRIFCLQNVSSYESAAKSKLSKKSNIQTLQLHWSEREEDCDDIGVMEGLKPHSNLKSLTISGYQSSKFPSWMITKNDLLLLNNLVEINFEKLNKCERLPSFGHLPCLKYLCISELHNVKCIGEEFYGLSNMDWASKSNRSKGAEITVFPALWRLKLLNMNGLVEWSDAIIPSHPSVKAFPCLEVMSIGALPQLSVLPNLGSLSSLKHLFIIGVERLTSLWNLNRFTSLQQLEIQDCGSLTCLSADSEGLHGLHSLQRLYINSCLRLVVTPGLRDLQSLRYISIVGVDDLSEPFCSLETLMALEFLWIGWDPCLWPKDLSNQTSLRTLILAGYYSTLDCFPCPFSFSFSNSMSTSEDADDVQHFVSLTKLILHGWPRVTSLCDQFQYLTTLKDLEIRNFYGLEALPEWLGNFESLRSLQVEDCHNLKALPSAQAFQRLTNLEYLKVSGCPLLEEKCTEESGSEWNKIAHISQIEIF